MSEKGLDLFGEMLMNRVHDDAIDDWERIFEVIMNETSSLLVTA
ncbi:hypothetical protein P9D43_27910 [Neobacillus niacini]|nr:hypothetical protein [Neobacillus niacini]MEC1525829.1 hypothetical protein [Neobacillus niacini]